MIIGTQGDNMENIMRDMKRHTSEKLREVITANSKESRREWMLWMMQRAGQKNSNNSGFQFWQQHNHPIDLVTAKFTDQKINYIHDNPVKAGLVSEAHCYVFSSANPDTELKLEEY